MLVLILVSMVLSVTGIMLMPTANLSHIHFVMSVRFFPFLSMLVLIRWVAASLSPILNQVSSPNTSICRRKLNVSFLTPHPFSWSSRSARPYIMVSMSGQTYSPYSQ